MRSFAHLRIAIGLGLLITGEVRAQPQQPLDDVLCLKASPARRVDPALRFTAHTAISLRNRAIGSRAITVDVRKPLGLCLPAGIGGGSPTDPAAFLESYGAKLSKTRPVQIRPTLDVQRVTNRFGTDELRLKALTDVMIPSSAVLDPPPGAAAVASTRDELACYDAERVTSPKGRPAAPSPLAIESAIGIFQFDVKAPTRVCFPTDLGGTHPNAPSHLQALACYRAKMSRTKPKQGKPFPRDVATANRFGAEQLTLSTTLDLCVSSEVRSVNASPTPQRTANPTPTPTVTPPPDFSLRIDPKEVTVDIGTSAHFTATAVYKNGNLVDFTERVVWRSSTAVGLAPNVAGDRGRIDAVDGGETVISVFDEATGVASTDTGDDAILTVNWTLQRIELLPLTVTRGRGESVRLRATGHFAGGFTRSIAERLTYASSVPSVAAPTNDPVPANHSRVIAVGQGSATLLATDPLSGVSSTTSGDDVAMTVVGPLERCEILPVGVGANNVVGIATGDFYQLTAHGFYPGGFQRVVTQQVEWTSDDPTVVAAPNTEGDRSRVLGLTPGEAYITATDTVTGIQCEGRPKVGVGTPTALFLQPPDPNHWVPIRAGRSWHAIAVLKFPPPISKEYVTERVTFTSSDPAIVAVPNVAGDRGRLDAVGSGTATIFATDPTTGLVSQSISLRSLAGLTRVELSDGTMSVLDVGQSSFASAIGIFGDGPATLYSAEVTFVSDNPTVVAVEKSHLFHWRIRALAPGVATVSAIDNQTGISSDAFGNSLRIGVRGPVERITLIPPQVTRRAGEAQPFAVIIHYVGGASEIGTDKVEYSSSALDVAVATNNFLVRGKVEAIAGGTAVISARDPATGVSSDDSGASATLTVVGPLTRIRIQPSQVSRTMGRSFSFTAIGNDAGGRSVNVTQDVVWTSSNEIAIAPNTEGNRSRIVANFITGTAVIAAQDPESSVTSTASGESATFAVAGHLTALTLSSERSVIAVGESLQVTATGYVSNGLPSINLTQEVEYTSSNPSVVKAENTPGDRSRLRALKAGSASISAFDPATGFTTTGSQRVTLVVTPP